MTQFTLFFARLVDLIGSEKAAALVNELAGQTIQFPVAGHNAELIKRTVTPRLTILFNGIPYDVSHLPGVAVGDVITVTVADLKPIQRDDFGFPIDAPIIGERYSLLAGVAASATARGNALRAEMATKDQSARHKPLLEAEAKALADKLVQPRAAYQPTAKDIAFRDAVLSVATACNVSLSAAIRLLMAERQRSTAPLSSAGTAPAPDQSGSADHASPEAPPTADPNQ